jgi:membrane protease YdiL (CAAX protease family)
MKKIKYIFCIIGFEIAIILCIAAANIFCSAYYLFYNGIYGLGLSVFIPLFFMIRKKEIFDSIGIKKLHIRQWIVFISFIVFSIGGQLTSCAINNIELNIALLSICFFPLVMTTFFEELLFRGFFQTRLEKEFGTVCAILISGAMFSLYHLGYPGFRSVNDLLMLFGVGTGFAIAYAVSGNNFLVAYFVNLPNAFLTYMLKADQFPVLTKTSSIFALLSIIAIIIFFIGVSSYVIKNKYSVAGSHCGKANQSL